MHQNSNSAPKHPVRMPFGLVLVLALGFARPVVAQDPAAAKAPATGSYTDEQAERGSGVFTRTCVECHTRTDMSSADFRLKWNGRTVFDLFDQIRTTMPDATPGSMTPAEYADVTAYFLKLNGMPAGSMPLPADSTLRAVKLDIPAAPPGQFVPGQFVPGQFVPGQFVMRSMPPRDARAAMQPTMQPTMRSRAVHSLPIRRGS